ncbi:precorrin-8X methylmutase [Larsenimonas rhizosphaerae]|uniref:Precorrin-8X methylmutase n=1 Tax=Larsenimonas rhizosphaerae TaxID=2944682 RepID=A0AA41ZLS5_9GAMM|nr:precorrin-8X methylmutase [Larsenimonas rhizosphaerae]MCX2523185.1 precorrin-8X methylmutase [Larsenimonas rhizosphaerae]
MTVSDWPAYEHDPRAIEAESFRRIRELTPLDGLTEDDAQVALRLVHTCGQPDIVDVLRISPGATDAGRAALCAQAAVLCDVEMVRFGLTQRFLEARGITPSCFLRDPATIEQARARQETRTMAALSAWRPHMEGAIVLIGNAPTALFRLLEMIRDGAPKPALIIGMPVGFVGAAESKALLWNTSQSLGVPCMTLLGRQGGSALTAAAFNTLLRLDVGERY